MIFSRLNSGMTLMSVMFALAIAGTVLTPIFITQGSAMERIQKEAQAVLQLFAAQQFLYDAEIAYASNAQIPAQKKITNPSMHISFSESEPQKKSALSRFSDITVRKISWQWQERREQKTDQLISLLYKRKEQPE